MYCKYCKQDKEEKHFTTNGVSKNGKVWKLHRCITCWEIKKCETDPERKKKREKSRSKESLLRKWKNRDKRYCETLHSLYVKKLMRIKGLDYKNEDLVKLETELLKLKRTIKKYENI